MNSSNLGLYDREPLESSGMSVQVSVVVPTYKRTQLLSNCLKALLEQDFPPRAYEIIIVDDAVWDETRLLVAEFLEKTKSERITQGYRTDSELFPDIRYLVARDTQGPAAARNIGWRLARGDIVAFTDDDCLPEPDWLKEGVAALKEGKDGVSGRVIVPISGTPTDYEKNVSRLERSEFVTANCFYRCQALETCGGFDERYTMAWREDSDLQFGMLTSSCKLGYAPAARVIHPARPAPWGISLKEQRKSMFNALLYKKYSRLYRESIQRFPPFRYYAIVFFVVVFLWAILTGNRPVALSAALLWGLFTLQFALQRLTGTKHTPSRILEMLFTSILIPPLSVYWRLYGAFYFRVFFL
jgi:glycosyltransferase involved in cell wall biosynthesis